jgi:hypothetical protein
VEFGLFLGVWSHWLAFFCFGVSAIEFPGRPLKFGELYRKAPLPMFSALSEQHARMIE